MKVVASSNIIYIIYSLLVEYLVESGNIVEEYHI